MLHSQHADCANSSSSGSTAAADTQPSQRPGNLIELLDIAEYLVLKKPGEEGPDVKGGYLDALIVHASQAQKQQRHTSDNSKSLTTHFISCS